MNKINLTGLDNESELTKAQVVLAYLNEHPEMLIEERCLNILKECKRIIAKYPEAGHIKPQGDTIINGINFGDLSEPWSPEEAKKQQSDKIMERLEVLKAYIHPDFKYRDLTIELDSPSPGYSAFEMAQVVYQYLEQDQEFWMTEDGKKIFARCTRIAFDNFNSPCDEY